MTVKRGRLKSFDFPKVAEIKDVEAENNCDAED